MFATPATYLSTISFQHMTQHHNNSISSVMDMEMKMNNEEDAGNNNVTNQLILGLAAHPLSSCNPPPRELPDLLDSLIASDSRLREQLVRIEKVGQGFARRMVDLKNRLHQLRAANANFKKDNQTPTKSSRISKKRQVFEAQERILQKMWLQVAFIHDSFVVKIRNMTISTIKAHYDIFEEFIGRRHAHPGIGIADSTKLFCIPGCDWYQKHGPYEWSKKPYTNLWWEEMNHTDWDWLRIKEHISAAVTVGGGKVTAMYDMLQANAQKFVPSWFWSEDFETWTMQGDVESVKNKEGVMECKVVIKVRFNKSAAAIQRETVEKLKKMNETRKQQGKGGLELSQQLIDSTAAEIEKIGETVIDENLVFDAMASMAGDRGGSQQVRWLTWWDFEGWHAEAVQKRAARQAGGQ